MIMNKTELLLNEGWKFHFGEPDTSQQQERMRALKIHALNKHIVSFGAAKRKRNTSSLLAVIFIPQNRKE